MRRDFHFYAVYAILKHVGVTSSIAQEIAYASEYVDDAKEDRLITFESGGQFRPLVTAHSIFDPKLYSNEKALATYAPFHFFPCLEGSNYFERMATKPYSVGIQLLKKQIISLLTKSFGRQYLGLALHILADSFAHQGFSAIETSSNAVTHLKIESSGLLDITLPAAGEWFPPLAHLQATTCPDEPACIWAYTNSDGRVIRADNSKRYMDASRFIYDFVGTEVRRACPLWFDQTCQSFDILRPKLQKMFMLNMLLSDRIKAWQNAFEHDYFDCQAPEFYDPRAWSKVGFESLANFKTSQYYRFHDAAAHHLHLCRYELFNQFDILI